MMKDAKLKDCGATSHDGIFENVPIELVRHIYSFFDIGSLGKMAQMNSSGILSNCASNDTVWSELVYRRFGIHAKLSRSTAHGGSTWKEAFRTMSYCNRAPKSRHTSTRKAIFAKGGGGKHCDPVSAWVLLSHTANCQTRRHPLSKATFDTTAYNGSNRFIEFHVCLQNVKTSKGPIAVDLMGSTLDLLGSCGRQSLCGWPRIIFKSGQDMATMEEETLHDGIQLKPFDFCIVAMTFQCGTDIFETDVLARALALRVPLLSSDLIVTAAFVPECDVWKHYDELPGGFLALNDKTSLIKG